MKFTNVSGKELRRLIFPLNGTPYCMDDMLRNEPQNCIVLYNNGKDEFGDIYVQIIINGWSAKNGLEEWEKLEKERDYQREFNEVIND